MSEKQVSESIDIVAPAGVIFSILADPKQHSRIDGSGTVREATSGPDRLELGSTFGMNMRMGAPYRTSNRVVEFEPDRFMAWRHFGPHRWRYELEPITDGTQVTETWDISYEAAITRVGLRVAGFPGRARRGIAATLVKLKAVAESDAAESDATGAPA